ncbi:S-adenosyl-L-methionine-dependent methyltransferase [Whalleya microplaca]|nr:S-adenosyl-L-methionine-dependent methyltransferase [Whalleya microplaca]
MASASARAEALQIASDITLSLSGEREQALSEAARTTALHAATKLVTCLEKPADGMLKLAYSPAVWMSIRTCVQLGVFSMLPDQAEISAEEIAQRTGANETLIKRLLRVLTAGGYVAEKGDGLYGATAWTTHLQQRTTEGMVRFIYDLFMPLFSGLPKWLESTGYSNPSDPSRGIFQASFNCEGEGLFPWLAKPENEDIWNNANTFFEGDRGSRPSWVTWFPIKEKLIDGTISKYPLLVDIAGGRGHDITEFQQQFPDQAGRLILQDQQQVLDSANSLSSRIEKRSIDFFTQSPIQDARIYFMKFIMHDYSDEDCIRILRNVTTAMKPEYSYLVINDFIIPGVGCSLLPAQWDLMMLVSLSAMERTESQWTTLLESAGLHIEGFYQPLGDGQGIIVATLK